MEVRIMSWNMAGAKLFDQLDPAPGSAARSYISAFQKVWKNSIHPWLETPDKDLPDIILLQECIGFEDRSTSPSDHWQSGGSILGEIFPGYECFFFPAVSSHSNPHPGKWNRYVANGETSHSIPAHVDIQQGYGICIREGISRRKLWVPEPDTQHAPADTDQADKGCLSCFEPINITTGLYLGDRDTEPRLIVMGRAKLETDGGSRYLNYLNIHLHTLSGEREGNVRLNRRAKSARLQQIEMILDNVVSAYQETTNYRMSAGTRQSERDIWVIGGDFNTTPDSAEIEMMLDAGFVDAIQDKRIQDTDTSSTLDGQIGSKWSLNDASCPAILLDYIFCGLEQFTFPVGGLDVSGSKRPFKPYFDNAAFASDHAVLFAKLKL